MSEVEWNNLYHAQANDCTDMDCEIHQIEVGLREEVVTETDLAFYIAGMYAAATLLFPRTAWGANKVRAEVASRFDSLLEERK